MKAKTLWHYSFPRNPEYRGRVDRLEGDMYAHSREQVISQFLAKANCLFLYEEYRERADVHIRPKRLAQPRQPEVQDEYTAQEPLQGKLF